jgi:hypothetical protein
MPAPPAKGIITRKGRDSGTEAQGPEVVEDPVVRLASTIASKVMFRLDPVKEAIAKELQQRLLLLGREHFLKDLALLQPSITAQAPFRNSSRSKRACHARLPLPFSRTPRTSSPSAYRTRTQSASKTNSRWHIPARSFKICPITERTSVR